jgi:hypothetical protein
VPAALCAGLRLQDHPTPGPRGGSPGRRLGEPQNGPRAREGRGPRGRQIDQLARVARQVVEALPAPLVAHVLEPEAPEADQPLAEEQLERQLSVGEGGG